MLSDTNRNISGIEVKAIKAVDLVENIQPDQIMISLQKSDGKIEALRSNIESNEEMMKALMEQLKNVRAQIEVFRGAEQILKLNQEVKQEIMQIKKIEALCEQHADKVESVFTQVQKTFEEFNDFEIKLDDINHDIKDLKSTNAKISTTIPALVTKKELENNISKFEKDIDRAKKITTELTDINKKIDYNLKHVKKELQLEFDLKLNKAEMLSEAFTKLMEENPLFAKGLNMQTYLNEQIRKIEDQLNDIKKQDILQNEDKTKKEEKITDKETHKEKNIQ